MVTTMVLLALVLTLALGFALAVVGGMLLGEKDGEGYTFCAFAALVILAGSVEAYFFGFGNLSRGIGFFKVDAIYETVSSAPVADGKYAVILREQDGDLSAHLLSKNPPKIFKMVKSTGNNNPFQPYP